MAKGGKRHGAGRPKGSGNRPALPASPLQIAAQTGDLLAAMQPEAADPEVARKVAALVATGMAEADIAVVVQLGVRKLRKFYRRELVHGATITRADAIASLQAAAAKGNASASKALLSLMGEPMADDDPEDAPAPNSHLAKTLRVLEGGKS